MKMSTFSHSHRGFSMAVRSFALACLLGIALTVFFCPAIAHAEALSAADALELNKTAADDGDGTYTVTLESYATAAVEAVPTDVVLLLDRSGSMYDAAEIDTSQEKNGVYMTDTLTYAELNSLTLEEKSNGPQQAGYYMMARAGNLYCIQWDGSKWVKYPMRVKNDSSTNYKKGAVHTYRTETTPKSLTSADRSDGIFYKSIFGVSYDGVRTFLDEVSGASNMRVAIVGFGAYDEKDWAGTGFYSGSKFCCYDDYKYSSSEFKNAFRFVDDASDLQELYASLKIYEPAINQTATGAGFRITEELFDLTPGDEAKNVVVIFTDGEPTGTPNSNASASTAAEHAKDRANVLKSSKYDAEIYAIGPQGGSASVATLKYYASDPDESYFFNPSASETADAFGQIAQYIVDGSGELNEKTVVRDVVSPYFSLPVGVKVSDIKVYTADYMGDDEDGKKKFADPVPFNDAAVVIDAKAKTVEVSNFDYGTNAVYMTGSDANGKKLIVEMPISPNPDFLGGDGVFTNESVSGVYSNGDRIEAFPMPTVNVPVKKIQPKATGGHIYISQEAELPHVANIGYFIVDGEEYVIDGLNNGYVDITYKVWDGSSYISCTIPMGTTYKQMEANPPAWTKSGEIDERAVLENDTKYKVTCDVVSRNNSSNVSHDESYATIYVYKPVVTFEDSEIELGNSAKYYVDNDSEVDNYVSVRWVDATGATPTTEAQKKLGVAPELKYAYSPAEAAFPDDTEVKVTSVVSPKRGLNKDNAFNHAVPNDFNLLEAGGVTFRREACDVCGHEAGEVADGGVNFVVHLKRADLVVGKADLDMGLDKFQSTIFEVEFADQNVAGAPALEVVVQGNGSVVIKDLPVGTYVVTEKTDWSWRYVLESVSVAGADGSAIDSQLVNASCTFGLPKGGATVTFENDRKDIYWLDGNCWCKNIFKKVASTDAPSAN